MDGAKRRNCCSLALFFKVMDEQNGVRANEDDWVFIRGRQKGVMSGW